MMNFSVDLCIVLLTLICCTYGANNYAPIIVDLENKEPGFTIFKPVDVEKNKYPEKFIIDIININNNVSFFVIQAHAYVDNITLSFTDPLTENQYVSGSNIGLVWSRNMIDRVFHSGDTTRFYLLRQYLYSNKLNILIAVSTYSDDDPIPGGCNFELETMIAPYQKISYDSDLITIMHTPPSKNEVFCDANNITSDAYYLYLKEYNNDSSEYFNGIEKMLTVDNILKYGTKVPGGLRYNKTKHIYNVYRGTGRVFAIISSFNGKSSAYVPVVSYGCNLGKWSEDCVGPVGVHWKIMCAFLLILGTFICFEGHRYFKAGLFTMGFTFGAMFTLVGISFDDYFSAEVKALFSVSAGIVCGVFWFLVWSYYGAPLVSVLLTFFLSGVLMASIFLYNDLGDLIFFTNDIFFWSIFSIIVVLTVSTIFISPSLFHIIALSLLGSYSIVVALNYYVGGNLPYILINTYRRIAVENFRFAVVDPPFQMLDICQTILWGLLFGLGIFGQYRHSIGKAPFPPQRSREVISQNDYGIPEEYPETVVTTPNNQNETTPLLRDTRDFPPPYEK